jgi:hypothetical protein
VRGAAAQPVEHDQEAAPHAYTRRTRRPSPVRIS